MEKIIEVESLKFNYKKDKQIIKNISFDVNKGEVFGFLGPNGSGKSTSQKLITGILKRYDGNIAILGKNMRDWNYDLYNYLSVLFEYPYLYTSLSAVDNLKYFASFYHKDKRRNIDELLKLVELKKEFKNKSISSYSKGMRQRTSMARALISSPEILFLDEPTSGLDPAGAVLFRNIVEKEKEKGTTIFLTTHNMHDAELLCDRVAFIVDGEIVAIDSPDNFKALYKNEYIEINYIFENELNKKEITEEELKNGINFNYDKIVSIHSKEPDLENIFIRLTGRGLE